MFFNKSKSVLFLLYMNVLFLYVRIILDYMNTHRKLSSCINYMLRFIIYAEYYLKQKFVIEIPDDN